MYSEQPRSERRTLGGEWKSDHGAEPRAPTHLAPEHACDLAKIIPAARAVREQVDWAQVAGETEENDFAVVTLILLERLGVIDGAATPEGSST